MQNNRASWVSPGSKFKNQGETMQNAQSWSSAAQLGSVKDPGEDLNGHTKEHLEVPWSLSIWGFIDHNQHHELGMEKD